MTGKELLIDLGNISHKYFDEAENDTINEAQVHRIFIRPMLVAAIIVLMLALMGCMAYFYTLEQYVIIDHTKEVIDAIDDNKHEMVSNNTIETVLETTAGPIVSEQVLSLQGYEGSPSYHALKEWWEYAIDYTIQNPELRFTSEFQRPEAYTKYPCYSQEMVDKVDEICGKYGLHLLGKSLFITDAEGMKEYGLSDVLSEKVKPLCFYGHLYEDGSFVASGELEFSDSYEKTVQFKMSNIKKDAFYTTHLGLNNISDYVQWNYKTQDGYKGLLALNDNTGLILVENEGRFISVIISEVPDSNTGFTGLPKEKEFLEMVCDCFMYSDLENVPNE